MRPVEDGEACRLVPARRGLARAARLGLPLSEGARLAHTPPLHAREAQRVRRGAAQAAEAAQPVDLARVRVGVDLCRERRALLARLARLARPAAEGPREQPRRHGECGAAEQAHALVPRRRVARPRVERGQLARRGEAQQQRAARAPARARVAQGSQGAGLAQPEAAREALGLVQV